MGLFSAKAEKSHHEMDYRRVFYTCSKCKWNIGEHPTAKFCPHCGRRLKYKTHGPHGLCCEVLRFEMDFV